MSSLESRNLYIPKAWNTLVLRELWKKFGLSLNELLRSFFLVLVYIYRGFFGFWFGGACRFEPSCSSYAVEALKTHSLKSSLILIFKRIIKCRPGGSYGIDPVPCCKEEKH